MLDHCPFSAKGTTGSHVTSAPKAHAPPGDTHAHTQSPLPSAPGKRFRNDATQKYCPQQRGAASPLPRKTRRVRIDFTFHTSVRFDFEPDGSHFFRPFGGVAREEMHLCRNPVFLLGCRDLGCFWEWGSTGDSRKPQLIHLNSGSAGVKRHRKRSVLLLDAPQSIVKKSSKNFQQAILAANMKVRF